jgi:hypothetical protein
VPASTVTKKKAPAKKIIRKNEKQGTVFTKVTVYVQHTQLNKRAYTGFDPVSSIQNVLDDYQPDVADYVLVVERVKESEFKELNGG